MGLRAQIYRGSLGDCSNGGISGRVNEVTIINVEGPFDPTPEAPAVRLVRGNIWGSVKIVVEDDDSRGPERVGPMFGGTFVATSDSRFADAVDKLIGTRGGAVALHDRYETAAEYARYST